MNFKDIPQFTKTPTYRVGVPLSMLVETLERYAPINLDPVWQRPHVWTEKQQIAYMEYFLRGGQAATEILFNHPHWMGSFAGEMVLVDGKQRINSALRFLNNEIPVFNTLIAQFEDKLPTLRLFTFCVNDLKTESEVVQWYIDLNSGGTPHTEDEINHAKNILVALDGR